MGLGRRWRQSRIKGPYRLFFFLVLLPMLCVFPYVRTVNNPNEFVRVFTVMAMVENGSFRIDEQVNSFGWVNDMAKVKGKDDGVDHYFMVKAPGVVFAGVPGYLIFSKVIAPLLGKSYATHAVAKASSEDRLWWLRMSTWALRIFTSQIPCFLFLLWLERYLRAFSPDPAFRYSAIAAAGLGTNYLAYTNIYASHSQYAAVAFLAFAFVERELRLSRGDPKEMRLSKAFLAGFWTSACVTLEYHSLFLTIVLSLFAMAVFWTVRASILVVLLGGAYCACLIWNLPKGLVVGGVAGLFALVSVVGFFKPSFAMFDPRKFLVNPTRLIVYGIGGLVNVPPVMYFHWKAYGNPLTPGHQMLETQKFAIEHQTGLWGVIWPTWEHVKALAVDPSFGFFGMSPFMWIGLIGVPFLLLSPKAPPTGRTHYRIITFVWFLCGLTLFLVNAGIIEWRAGWTVGPRYLAACPPFFAFGSVIALERFAAGNIGRRALARGFAGGLALASVLAIGTVSLVYDTLPETIARPMAQFAFPMIFTGFVPHHVAEWFGWTSPTFWYIACGAMLLAPVVAGLWAYSGERRAHVALRVFSFVVACAAGLGPAFTTPEDGSTLFVMHPSTTSFPQAWEPAGRDRITLLREEAERYGTRGRGPCILYHLAELEHIAGLEPAALRDEAKAKSAMPKERCRKVYF